MKKSTGTNGISRRDFIKGAAAGAVGVAAMGLLGACTSDSNESSTTAETSGTESTSASASAEGTTAETSSAVSDAAAVENIPIVSGTAPGEVSEEELAESLVVSEAITDFAEEYDYDVVVVGGGAAGVPAALAAIEEGVKVALLQKQSIIVSQGNSGSGIDLEKTDAMGKYQLMMATNELCGWRANWSLMKVYFEQSGEIVKKIAEAAEQGGYPAVISSHEYDYEDGAYHAATYTTFFGPKPENAGNGMGAVANVAEELGADIYYETPGVQLVTEGGKVTGVIGKNSDGDYLKFNAAKGVILATGDYENNPAMVEKYCPDAADFDKKQYQKTGDGHLMGMLAGAKMEPLNHTKMLHDFDSGPMYEEPFLALNDNGERFMNEQTVFEYVNNVVRTQPNPGWYSQVFDNDYYNYVSEWGGSPADEETLTKYIPGAVEEPQGVFKELLDTHRCDTLEELAEALQIEDVDAFTASVKRYNELCESGVDEDFGKLPKYMKPIQTAPFWGIRKHLRVSALCSGLMIDDNGQCLDAEGEPIEGLFAAGNCSGPFYGGIDYPLNIYGMSLGRCYTFGYITGKYVAGL